MEIWAELPLSAVRRKVFQSRIDLIIEPSNIFDNEIDLIIEPSNIF